MISLGTSSIALLPFWCFDAKGGEVVLLGLSVGFAWVGRKHLLLSFLESLCPFIAMSNHLLYCLVVKLIPMWCDELCLCVVLRQWNW